MFKRPKAVVGLEIDPAAVRAVTLAPSGDVDTAAERPLEPGVVSDGGVTDATSLAEALRGLFADEKLPIRVRVGIASQRVLVRSMHLPVIDDASELDVAVRFHAQDALPMPLDGAVLDYVRMGLVDTPEGPRTRIVLVAARRDMIGGVLAAVRGAGLRPEAIDLAAFAMVRSLADQVEDDEPTLYLSVGGLTNVAIARGSTCEFTRVVGQGLEGIAAELAGRRACTRDEAHTALLEHGVEGDADIASIVQGGLRRVAAEVRTSTDYHASVEPGAVVRRCVLTGPALDVPGLPAMLSRDLGLPIQPGTSSGGGNRFATASGLCLAEQRS